MWSWFNWKIKKKKTTGKKKKTVGKENYNSRTASSKSGHRKNLDIKPEDFKKPLQKPIDKKEPKPIKTLSSIEQLRKEFEEKQKVINALETKLRHKGENNLLEKKQKAISELNEKKNNIPKIDQDVNNQPVIKPESEAAVNHPEIEKEKESVISELENVFKIIDETLEDGFLGGVVVDKTTHQILYAHNIEANDTSFLAQLLENLEQSLKKSSFPPLNKFYMMDLVDDYLMLNLLFPNQIYYLIFNKNETNLGLILNVLYDKIKQKHFEIINNLK